MTRLQDTAVGTVTRLQDTAVGTVTRLQNTAVGTVTRLQDTAVGTGQCSWYRIGYRTDDRRPTNRRPIIGRSNKVFSRPQTADQLLGPRNLLRNG